MAAIQRIGVSLEDKLLLSFDKLIASQGYSNRSEAIRDLIRDQLSEQQLTKPKAKAVAAVFLVYDHHSKGLQNRLAQLQHSHFLKTISSMHIHIDPHNCLEVIVLRGRVGEIAKMAEKIVSLKGVKLSRVNLIAIGNKLI